MALALHTFGQFLQPSADPANDGFHDVNDGLFDLAEAAPGFVGRSGYAIDLEESSGPAVWGKEVYPKHYRENGDGWAPATLSLWCDIESLFAYTYFGAHAETMKQGRLWFERPQWPPLTLWWHEREAPPDWAEGVRRMEFLEAHGPTAQAFTFKTCFDAGGAPYHLDKGRIKAQRLS